MMCRYGKLTDSVENMGSHPRITRSVSIGRMPVDEFEQNVAHSYSVPRRTRSDGGYRKKLSRLYQGSNNLANFLSDDSSSEFNADKGRFPTTFHYHHVGHHDAYAEEPETKLT